MNLKKTVKFDDEEKVKSVLERLAVVKQEINKISNKKL